MSIPSKLKNVRRAVLTTASAVAILASGAAYAADLSGRISDSENAVALEGAIVQIKELNRRTVTNAEGGYYFGNIPAGEYTLIINYIGTDPIERKVTVSEDRGKLDIAYGANEGVDEVIVVTGLRGSLNSSLAKQRSADNVANFLSADAAGNFPDQNVSEAVRRIVGLSVANDQGEGRFVIIRGIDPNLSSSSIGGVRLPSPEGGDRQVALDIFPSEILESVEVTKSLTPDVDGDAIGGNVDIKTLSGFDRDGLFVKAKLEGSYNRQQDDISPKGALTIANKFSDRFAIAGSFSYFDRDFGSDNVEVDGGWINEDDEDQTIDALIPEELEFRDYVISRRRIAAALNLDFKPTDSTDLYIRSLYSNFKDSEIRSRVELKFDEGEFDLDNTNTADGVAFQNGIEADRDVRNRVETQKILTVQAGGETRLDSMRIEYSASYSKAEENEPNRFDIDFAGEDFNAGVNFRNRLLPNSAFLNQADFDGIRDASAYELDTIEFGNNFTDDEQIAFKLDIAKDLYWNDNPVLIKWGAKARLREKSRNDSTIVYDGNLGDVTLADFRTDIDFPPDFAVGDFGPDAAAVEDYFRANVSTFEINEADTLIASDAVDYEAEENIYASYILGRIDVGALRVIGGVRYEYTDFKTSSNFVTVGEEIVRDADGNPVLDDEGEPETEDVTSVSPVNTDRDYGHWLPSVNLRYELKPNLLLRAAYFRSVVRPNIDDIIPTGEIEFEDEFEDGEIDRTTEGTIGNGALVPLTSNNLDFGIEWYPNNDSIISAGVFYKKIKNFVVDRTLEDVTINGIDFSEVVQPFNGDEATVKGIELNYQQALTFLPGPLDGIILGLNYTYVDSDATIDTGEEVREIPLPRTSKNIANIVLGYEKGPLTLRAALTYRDEYLDEVDSEGFGDRYVLDHKQWDFSASYEIYDGVKLYGTMSNVNDRPFQAAFRTGGQDFLAQYEEYDWTASFGVKAKF
ncbi:TonB-dependent receptor [Kordiimonas laminariae]|uniref:TonB-dependent receptor n=1 Tax=Kordiimonas laminariae TaxID=2917717 RepID=UPI001FF54B50|nr:TonB-dependent receptor [Kordiimonas laminariae]MCK0070591.1 TonB-dependent receptor [Kordiimonas laminariae]